MKGVLIGIDAGCTAVKAAAFDAGMGAFFAQAKQRLVLRRGAREEGLGALPMEKGLPFADGSY